VGAVGGVEGSGGGGGVSTTWRRRESLPDARAAVQFALNPAAGSALTEAPGRAWRSH
jgi:hypothetical protein